MSKLDYNNWYYKYRFLILNNIEPCQFDALWTILFNIEFEIGRLD